MSDAGCNPVAAKMVGPRTSLRRDMQGHHAERTVSQDPPPPPQYQTPARHELPFLHPDDACMEFTGSRSEGYERTKNMPRNRSAIAALQKLEADREALDAKQRELEAQAAKELGQIILGTGLETFSKKGLKQVAEALGKLGETAAIAKLAERSAGRTSTASPGTE